MTVDIVIDLPAARREREQEQASPGLEGPQVIDHQERPARPMGAARADRLRLVPPSEMDWRGAQLNLVRGILGFNMMALLYGASGSAKTLIAFVHGAARCAWPGMVWPQGQEGLCRIPCA